MDESLRLLQGKIEEQSEFVRALQAEIGRVVVGQRGMVDALLISLLAGAGCAPVPATCFPPTFSGR